MRYDEEDLLPLSGVQHLVFCERQAALIHAEGMWADNALTVEGSHRHKRVHDDAPRRERRRDLMIVRGLSLCSFELGLSGVADVVEFRRLVSSEQPDEGRLPLGVQLLGVSGLWIPFPVEYKRGRPKPHRADEVQLCAQALCMEEMLGAQVADGALFYGKEQRRMGVTFAPELRALTREAANRLHELIRTGETPAAVKDKKCRSCSLASRCLPEAASRRGSVKSFVASEIDRMLCPERADS
ncbi:CRISPR-associated protein Cas4 [Candidatus Fermentibacteria bacterium]|nr:CRISPR-associated protein Cas4 [Candidatus Fermentibacteria bacterium]